MRHGKSDWSTRTTDHARPLTQRGIRSAERMGELLTEIGLAPDLVITSTANRAATTAELAAQAGNWDCPIEESDDLYDTSSYAVIERLQQIDGTVNRCLVVGHNPTWTALVHQLTGAAVAMKTATVAVINPPAQWSWLGGSTLELEALFQPRHFL